MNFLSFTNAVKNLWDSWNIKAVVLLSLTLQVFLILLAPLRKRTINRISILFIWVSYLLADWAASFAVGHISNGSKDSINPCDKEKFVSSVGHYFFSSGKAEVTSCGGDKQRDALSSSNNIDLLAFWAPFLLVHLGGPDTITAFALEDNELWRRHFFSLIVQLAATVYVFWLTLPKNKLWIPTLLMFGYSWLILAWGSSSKSMRAMLGQNWLWVSSWISVLLVVLIYLSEIKWIVPFYAKLIPAICLLSVLINVSLVLYSSLCLFLFFFCPELSMRNKVDCNILWIWCI